MESEIKWLWKMTSTEKFYETYTISYKLTLATLEPLRQEQITCALSHLFRKVPPLRTCYGIRSGEVWLREMTQEILDFEVVANSSVSEVNRDLQRYRYNTETGPLWCVKLLAEPPSSPEMPPGINASQYPHVYTLFLGTHHGITDGTSNMKICGWLVQLLDAVVEGKAIDDSEQLGVFTSDENTQKILKERAASVETDPELKQKLISNLQARQTDRSLLKSTFKGIGEAVPRTEVLELTLDADTTLAFVRRCRSEGVTVNSAFTALASIAVVDLLLDAGLRQDTYNIRSDHVLNARRYWDGDTSQYLGCHLLPLMPVTLKVPTNGSEAFWEIARTAHQEIMDKVNSGIPLLEEAVKHLVPQNSERDPTFEYEFCVTNMGNVTRVVSEGGSHVQALHVIRSVALHNVPCTWSLLFHTFRDRLILALTYSTQNVNTPLAKKFGDRIFYRLRETVQGNDS